MYIKLFDRPLLGGSSRGNVHRYTGRFFLTPNIHLGLEKSVRYSELSPISNFIRNGRRGTGSDCYRPFQRGVEGSKNCQIEPYVMVERSVKSFLIFSADKINEVLDKLQQNFEVQVVFL